MLGLFALCELGRGTEWPTSIALEEAEATIADALGTTRAKAKRVIHAFSLTARDSFFPAPEPFGKEDLYPWRFNRQLSYLRRPLLRTGKNLVYGPAAIFRTIEYVTDLISEGRLRGHTAELKEAVSKIQAQAGSEFNDRVGRLFEELPHVQVHLRVQKVGGLRIERSPGQPLGDIDVLVIDPDSQTILALEAKALAVALTPHQLRNEIAETFAPTNSAFSRHQERCQWLQDHIPAILEQAAIEDDPANWTVQGMICVDQEVLSPLMISLSLPVRSWQQLRAAHANGDLY